MTRQILSVDLYKSVASVRSSSL